MTAGVVPSLVTAHVVMILMMVVIMAMMPLVVAMVSVRPEDHRVGAAVAATGGVPAR
jgi:hypothetical protein